MLGVCQHLLENELLGLHLSGVSLSLSLSLPPSLPLSSLPFHDLRESYLRGVMWTIRDCYA